MEAPVFLEIHTDRRRQNAYSYGLFRETYRDNGQVRHRTRGRVTGLPHEQLLALRDFIRSGCPQPGEASCEVLDSREWGASHAVLATAKALGLPKLLYSRTEEWVKYALAMIVGRVVYQGSKLALTNLWKDTALWWLCGRPGTSQGPPPANGDHVPSRRTGDARHHDHPDQPPG